MRKKSLMTVMFAICLMGMSFAACAGEDSDVSQGEQTVQTNEDTYDASQNSTGEVKTESQIESQTENRNQAEESESIRLWEEENVLLDQTQISLINDATIANEGSHVRDICAIHSLASQQLREDITAYSLPDTTYCDGHMVTQEDKDSILALRNLDAILDVVTLQYGVVTDNVAVRAMPTAVTMKNGTADRDFDYLQESMLLVGEGVVIAHTSLDGQYYFVYSYNYCGWVKADCVGLCGYEQMCQYVQNDNFVIFTENKTVSEVNDYVRMGTKIPYVLAESGIYVLSWPTSKEGQLVLSEVQVAAESCYYNGFLPYNTQNVVALYQRLLGVSYGWGDTNENMDCSSTVNSVYRCFGFLLPRNTSAMSYIGASVTDVSGQSDESKLEQITQCQSGAILLMPGHVMTYMAGYDAPSIIHNVLGYYDDDGVYQDVYQCALTPLAIYNAAGETYLSKITYIIQIP